MKKIYILLFCIMWTGCSSSSISPTYIETNYNENIIKEQTIDGLYMNNVSVLYEKGFTTFQVDVTNQSGQDIIKKKFDVIFKTTSGVVITTLHGSLENVNVGSVFHVVLTSDIDLSDAYSLEYKFEP